MQRLLKIGAVLLILLATSASYYKFVILADFETMFFVECNPEEEQCFVNTDSCENDSEIDGCAYFYKAYVVNQNLIDSSCEIDDGSCLISYCEQYSESCVALTCANVDASEFEITDECAI